MTLQWYRADEYHQKSSCGRFSVARVAAGLVLWYEAYAWPGRCLGATRVPITARPEERKAAARAMQELCEAEAGADPKQAADEPPTDG